MYMKEDNHCPTIIKGDNYLYGASILCDFTLLSSYICCVLQKVDL